MESSLCLESSFDIFPSASVENKLEILGFVSNDKTLEILWRRTLLQLSFRTLSVVVPKPTKRRYNKLAENSPEPKPSSEVYRYACYDSASSAADRP